VQGQRQPVLPDEGVLLRLLGQRCCVLAAVEPVAKLPVLALALAAAVSLHLAASALLELGLLLIRPAARAAAQEAPLERASPHLLQRAGASSYGRETLCVGRGLEISHLCTAHAAVNVLKTSTSGTVDSACTQCPSTPPFPRSVLCWEPALCAAEHKESSRSVNEESPLGWPD
jgi:hypothetical protein